MTVFNSPAFGRLARVGLAAALALGGTVAAYAQPQIDVNAHDAAGQETRTRLLSTSDLNLASAEGQRKLDKRLRIASGEVCGKYSEWGVRVPADYTRCYETTLGQARAKAGNRAAMADGMIRVAAN